jgi:hypothetical protein
MIQSSKEIKKDADRSPKKSRELSQQMRRAHESVMRGEILQWMHPASKFPGAPDPWSEMQSNRRKACRT